MWIGEFDDVLPRAEAFYPHSECGGIFSPHVRLLRTSQASGILKAESAPCISVLTAAAQDAGRDRSFSPELLQEKIRTVFHMAVAHGQQVLVLGAFGCGYFRNPPEVVAETFLTLLRTEFAACFALVVFAVPDRYGPNREAFAQRFPARSLEELDACLASHTPKGRAPGQAMRLAM